MRLSDPFPALTTSTNYQHHPEIHLPLQRNVAARILTHACHKTSGELIRDSKIGGPSGARQPLGVKVHTRPVPWSLCARFQVPTFQASSPKPVTQHVSLLFAAMAAVGPRSTTPDPGSGRSEILWICYLLLPNVYMAQVSQIIYHWGYIPSHYSTPSRKNSQSCFGRSCRRRMNARIS